MALWVACRIPIGEWIEHSMASRELRRQMIADWSTSAIVGMLKDAVGWYVYYLFAWLTSPLRGKPTFLIAGFKKCGTTYLAASLRGTPGVGGPNRLASLSKETHHYSNAHALYSMLPIRGFYGLAKGNEELFDASVEYGVSPKALRRIERQLSGIRVILVVREQVSRTESLVRYYGHQMKYQTGLVDALTPQRVDALDRRVLERLYMTVRSQGYSTDEAVARHLSDRDVAERDLYTLALDGSYHLWVEIAVAIFGADRVKVLAFEDVTGDTERVVAECREFLGLPAGAGGREATGSRNASTAAYRVDSGTAAALERLFAASNAALRELTGIELVRGGRE